MQASWIQDQISICWALRLHCRSVHIHMLPLRPSVHCPHVGKTGGACYNKDHVTNVTGNMFTGPPFIPEGLIT